MGETLTIRLSQDLSRWLEKVSRETGVPKGQLVREQLERARRDTRARPWLKLAGAVEGPADLSQRRGYSRK